MAFSFDRFYRLNRKAIIWIILFGLIYLLRDLFTLIFLTFIIGFCALPASRFITERFRVNRYLAISLVYIGILVGYVTIVRFVSPNLTREFGTIVAGLDETQTKLTGVYEEYLDETKHESLAPILNEYLPLEQFTGQLKTYREETIQPKVQIATLSRQLLGIAVESFLAILSVT